MALFPVYGIPPSAAEVFQQSMEKARRLRMDESKSAADIELSKANIDKIKDDISMSPIEKKYKLAAMNKMIQETNFMPLDYAIKGTQAENVGSRFGAAYQQAKILQTMTPDERAEFRARNPGAEEEILTNLGNQALEQQSKPEGNALNIMMRKYFPGGDQDMALTPTQIQKLKSNQEISGNIAIPTKFTDENDGSMIIPKNTTNKQRDEILNNLVNQASGAQFTSNPTAAELVSQNAPNNAGSTNDIKSRKNASVALETWIEQNRKDYVPRLNNALNYAGGKGALQLKTDALKGFAGNAPQGYQDYRWALDTFRPELVNQIKLMERMGATDEQRREAHGMLSALDSMTLDPKAAKNVFNQSVKSFQDLSDSIYNAAEPYHKGVTRKLSKLPKREGNYLDLKGESMESGQVKMQSPDGKIYLIPKENVDKAIKRGLKEV